MCLATPAKVEKLRKALHSKAKAEAEFRLYQFYDKVYREDILTHAWRLCRANGGAAGVDSQGFAEIESLGLEEWLGELAETLRNKAYLTSAVRRVWIEKANGKQRPLGIPTIRDRVVQTAVVLILEPIFEADLLPEQYAYRPNRSALDAVQHVHALVRRGYDEVVDADLSGYFDSIPHAEPMRSVARLISDLTARRMMLLDAEVVVGRLNRLLTGWGNYFYLGPVSQAYRAVDAHTRYRLRQWLRGKHKVASKGFHRYPDEYLYEHLGLVQLSTRTSNLPWAKA